MADYKINISVDSKDSDRKVDELNKKLKETTKPKKINIEFPNLSKVKQDLQEVSKYSGVAVQAFKQFTPIGRQFAELEDNVKVVGSGLANVGRTLQGLSAYANPVRGIADGFGAVSQSIDAAVRTTANLGFAIFGVTQSINVLRAAFGQAFQDTVGREVQLREQILQTATTLAGTNRVFAEGFEIKDPTEKLRVLEGSVTKSIERIRERSLEIAGTTSAAVIGVFNIVASQIGSFGGTMQQAEDLAVKFSGALGTLGMSDPGYARQEIGSIMMGNITTDSALAKTIGISNQDIQRARQQGKLYEYLTEKLAVFEAGQKIAAKGFAGITSNIQELQEELKRSFGSSLLDPILKRIEDFYDKVSGKDVLKSLMQTAKAFGQLIGGSLNSAYGTISRASIFQGIDSKGIQATADKLQAVFAKVAIFIQEQLARIAPAVQRIVDRVGQYVVILGRAFAEMAGTLARIKIDQLVVRLQALSALTPGIVVAAQAYSEYLKTIEDIVNTPLGRYINEIKEMNKVLREFGVFGVVNNIIAIRELKQQIPVLVTQIQAVGTAIGQAAVSTFNFLAGLYGRIATTAISLITTLGTSLTRTFTSLSIGLARIAAQAAQLLLTLSNTAVILGGSWSSLSAPLARLANAVAGMAVSLQRAGQDASAFGARMQQAMTQAQTSTQNAATTIAALGTRLRGGVAAGANAATAALTGLARGVLATMASMALWTAVLTLVFDLIRRIGEWWDNFSQDQKYKQAVDDINSGLLEQVKAAREAGKALDAVTEARKKLREDQLEETLRRDKEELNKYSEELYKRAKNIGDLRKVQEKNAPGALGDEASLTNEQIALRRDSGFSNKLAELKTRIKEAEKLLAALRGETNKEDKNDPQLKQQENRQAIAELAKFEKDTRRAIEDEVYNYRRQAQDKELQIWRQQGELRIQSIANQNQLLIDGVNSEARASLEALNNWLSSKRRGELEIESKKREAQMAAADLERTLGKFRINLEQQVAELRKRVAQYEFEVLDKRIKAEQLIANIRNGGIQMDSPEGVTGDTGLKMGSTGRSTGPHWHVAGAATEAEARAIFARGAEGVMTSPMGRRRNPVTGQMQNHNGWDLSGAALNRLVLANGYRMVDWVPKNGAMGNTVVVERIADRKRYQLGHTADPDPNWTFFQGTGKPGAAPGTRPARDFREGYLMRMSNLEGGYGINGSAAKNTRSNARGYFQLIPSTEQWLRSTGKGSIADGLLAKDFDTAAKAAYEYAVLMRPAARQLFAEGDTAGLDRLLNRLWTSLPGGAEAATGQRLANGNALLKVAGASRTTGAGSASQAVFGELPQSPNLTLNIDTSPVEAAIGRINTLNQELIELSKNQNALNSEEGFRAFEKSLDSTSADLERINKQVRDQTIDLNAVAAATKGGIFDPATLQANIRYQQSLAQLNVVRETQLKLLPQFKLATAEDRTRAEAKIKQAYEDNKKRLLDSLRLEQQLFDIEKKRQRLIELNESRRQAQIERLSSEAASRTEAAKASLDPYNFQGLRRLDAQQAIYGKYLEYTDGETRALTPEEAQNLRSLAEQALASADSLAAVDAELQSFAERLALARDSARTLTEGYKGLISNVINGGDLSEAVSQMGQNVAASFTEKILDYSFKPMEKQLESMFSKLFGVDDAQLANTNALTTLTTKVQELITAITTAATAPANPVLPPSTTPTPGIPPSGDPAVPTPDDATGKLAEGLDNNAKDINTATDQTLTGLQRYTTGLASVAATALGIAGGIQMAGKGGTYNTLMGLASIFGSIGSLTGMFGTGGLFAPKARATGGPVIARQPYLVGERGPELFMPASNGTVITNSRTRSLLDPEAAGPYGATTAALENRTFTNLNRLSSDPIKLETRVINGVEYATVDQLEQAARQAEMRGAQRGQAMAFGSMRNSIKTRKQLGI